MPFTRVEFANFSLLEQQRESDAFGESAMLQEEPVELEDLG